jgi:hypothetical protein
VSLAVITNTDLQLAAPEIFLMTATCVVLLSTCS